MKPGRQSLGDRAGPVIPLSSLTYLLSYNIRAIFQPLSERRLSGNQATVTVALSRPQREHANLNPGSVAH